MELGSWFNSRGGPSLQRKYIDLIYGKSTKYANWDPPKEIRVRPQFLSFPRIRLTLSMCVQVGAYGTLDKKTGEFLVEGNIYDAEIQRELDRQDIDLEMADFQPMEAAVEDSLAIAAQVSENGGLNAEVTACVLASLCMIVLACHVAGHILTFVHAHDRPIPGIASAPIKGEWQFKHGKHGAILVMYNQRQIYLARNGSVLEKLYRIDKLVDNYLVTSVQTCSAYSMYLSDKCAVVLFLVYLRYMC